MNNGEEDPQIEMQKKSLCCITENNRKCSALSDDIGDSRHESFAIDDFDVAQNLPFFAA